VSELQSALLAYQQALLAKLKTEFGSGVLVTDGPPPAAYLQTGQAVWIGDVEAVQSTVGLSAVSTLGTPTSGPKQELFDIEMYVSIYGATTPNATNIHELQQVTAFGILEQIGAVIRTDPTLGVTAAETGGPYVLFSEIAGGIKVIKGGNDQARETAIRFMISGRAYLE
jgi:hypothetical protein